MLIESITTLRTEDFPGEREWIGKLLTPLNSFLLSAVSAINGNITFDDNIPCMTVPLNFTYSGASDFPKKFRWTLNTRPVEVRLCSMLEGSVAVAGLISWSYADSQVSITNIFKVSSSGVSGLTVGTAYNIVVRGQP